MTAATNPGAVSSGDDVASAPPNHGRRVVFLDVARAIAMLGVVMMNATIVVFPAEMAGESEPSVLTSVLDTGLTLLMSGKARAMLMVLLGVGTLLAWRSAARHDGRPLVTMLRRYVVLGPLFGIPHLLAFSGDILTHYAITALLLAPLMPLLSMGSPHRPLWAAGVLFSFAPPFEYLLGAGPIQSTLIGPIPQTLGFFCVGVWLARRPELSPDFTRPNRLIAPMVWGGLGGQFLGVVLLVGADLLFPREFDANGVPVLGPDGVPVTPPPAELMGTLSSTLTGLGGALFYLGLVWWLLGRGGPGARMLGTLAPLGRVTLTTYLAGTVVFLSLKPFEGQVPMIAQYALAASYFVLMALVATWWRRRFRLGPLEWLWRTLTYLRPRPMRRARMAPKEAVGSVGREGTMDAPRPSTTGDGGE